MRAVTIVDNRLTIAEHPDPMQLKGFYPAPPGSPPDIPGFEEKAICARRMEAEVLPALVQRRLQAPVAAAYDRFAAGDKLGKVVLEVTPAGRMTPPGAVRRGAEGSPGDVMLDAV